MRVWEAGREECRSGLGIEPKEEEKQQLFKVSFMEPLDVLSSTLFAVVV